MTADPRPIVAHDHELEGGLREAAAEVGARRVLVLAPPSRRFVDRILGALDGCEVEVFAEARVHVPAEVVSRATDAVRAFGADTIVTVGGGATTGLGKALRLEHDLSFIAVPTTYAGSEQTDIFGVTAGAQKKTGRDARVRPDVIVYAAGLTLDLPAKLTAQSLMNALAHPVSALSTGTLDDASRGEALDVVRSIVLVLEALVAMPSSIEARVDALRAAARAGRIIDACTLGVHHRIAHVLGGRFDLEHAAVHALLLPHTVASLATDDPDLFAALTEAAGVPDLPAALYELLRRAGAETSLQQLGVQLATLETTLAEHADFPAPLVVRAYHGGRPSARVRLEDWGLGSDLRVTGPPLERARRVVVALHGRGSNAYDFITRVFEMTGDAPDVAIVAPQALRNRWYAKSYSASAAEHGDELTRALTTLQAVVSRVLETVDASRVLIVGFSQGACLAAELVARSMHPIGGLIAIAGARIGPLEEQPAPSPAVQGMPVLLGASEHDPWVPTAHVEETAAAFREAGAEVEVLRTQGDGHRITAVQRIRARELLLGRAVRATQPGFGNAHESEALEGALPREQNSPRHAPYGLYAEQVNATGFVALREENRRCWLYRMRPAAQQSTLERVEHPTLCSSFDALEPDPNLLGWSPLPLPDAPTDFVDGLATFGGAGSPRHRRGFAIHLYVANRSMEDRSFYDADGELLIVPQHGRLTLLTELGVLELDPGRIAVVPRGLKFSVLLRDDVARGWVGEVYGRSFRLPERGPIGSNGLAETRHFLAPTAYHEDRLAPGYRVTAKYMGELFESTRDHSPYDVVAWHGNLSPHVYDLERFCPVANVRVDHGDPSVYTVLSAPLDEQGAHSLDFVFFPPRWDNTEHTFRPPYFHRNAVTEFNGIIRAPSAAKPPFVAGAYYLTPSMTPHGVRVTAVERALAKSDERADAPERHHESSMWFQFETMMPVTLSSWAARADNRIRDWHHMWGAYRTHYTPPSHPGKESQR